jgi:hypothetical protein
MRGMSKIVNDPELAPTNFECSVRGLYAITDGFSLVAGVVRVVCRLDLGLRIPWFG